MGVTTLFTSKYPDVEWPENPIEGQVHLVDGRPKYNYQMAFQYNAGQWWRNYQKDRE